MINLKRYKSIKDYEYNYDEKSFYSGSYSINLKNGSLVGIPKNYFDEFKCTLLKSF